LLVTVTKLLPNFMWYLLVISSVVFSIFGFCSCCGGSGLHRPSTGYILVWCCSIVVGSSFRLLQALLLFHLWGWYVWWMIELILVWFITIFLVCPFVVLMVAVRMLFFVGHFGFPTSTKCVLYGMF
jgi:hypothetical protein